MPNKLIAETSPYLLQHANNPVNWYPWGTEALEKAKKEDKPIFLSIGYTACHWCHVMAHESFEDPEIAGILNQHFVNIKVDREERPDLDSIYMSAVVAMTGQGGWPMSVFLTPNGHPFFGGTYFPPQRRYGMPSFSEILNGIITIWQTKRDEITEAAQQLLHSLQANTSISLAGEGSVNPEILEKAAESLISSYDWENGGWGAAPKFPMPMAINFLLSRAAQGNAKAMDAAAHALKAMQRGGMYDLVGGGFHRYSTDPHWLVPHFEKMLYDNAQLALVYLHAFQLNGILRFKATCLETLQFIQEEMRHSGGGFFSSLDADSESEEGKFYTWEYKEICNLIKDPEDIRLLELTFGISLQGNFEGRNILQYSHEIDQANQVLQPDIQNTVNEERIKNLLNILQESRRNRVRPLTDDKILVCWNALTIQAFAEASRYLEQADFLVTAQNAANFLLGECYQDGVLFRSWREGKTKVPAFLEDYAALILALFSLYETDFDLHWYSTALELTEKMMSLFSDPSGGFSDTQPDQDALIIRPKEVQDNATPSGNAMAVMVLLKLAELSDRTDWNATAEQSLAAMQVIMRQHPRAFSFWLQALDFAVGNRQQVAIVWPDTASPPTEFLNTLVKSNYSPHRTIAGSRYPLANSVPALLKDKTLLAGKTTAYVCRDFVCKKPTFDPGEFLDQLNALP